MKKALLAGLLLLVLPHLADAAVCYTTGFSGGAGYQILNGDGAPGQDYSCSKFSVASNCNATGIGVWLARNGVRADNAKPYIYSDSAGSPGSVLATGSTNLTSGSYPTFVSSTSTISYSLTASTDYWMCVRDTVTADDDPFFQLGLGLSGTYTSKAWNGASYENANNPTDSIAFSIEGTAGGAANSCTYGGTGDWSVKFSDNCYISSNVYVNGACVFNYDAAGSFSLAAHISCNKVRGAAGFRIAGRNNTALLSIR